MSVYSEMCTEAEKKGLHPEIIVSEHLHSSRVNDGYGKSMEVQFRTPEILQITTRKRVVIWKGFLNSKWTDLEKQSRAAYNSVRRYRET